MHFEWKLRSNEEKAIKESTEVVNMKHMIDKIKYQVARHLYFTNHKQNEILLYWNFNFFIYKNYNTSSLWLAENTTKSIFLSYCLWDHSRML